MRRLFAPITLGALILFSGCARYPAGGSIGSSKQLIFTLKTAGPINPNYVYIVALTPLTDPNPTTQGPIPVITAPWGNGFVAGGVTHFVRWDPTTSPRYLLYKFTDTGLLNFVTVGAPFLYDDLLSGGNQLRFSLTLSQLLPTGASEGDYATLQVNFLTMDRIPQGSFGGSKVWDALGDSSTVSGANQFINVNLRVAGVYNNIRYGGLEPTGDTADPALDLQDFSVEVRNP